MSEHNIEQDIDFDIFDGISFNTGTEARPTVIHVASKADGAAGFWSSKAPFFGSELIPMERDGKSYPTHFSKTLQGSFVGSTTSQMEVFGRPDVLWGAFNYILTDSGREQLAIGGDNAKLLVPSSINLYRDTFEPIKNFLSAADTRPARARYWAIITPDGELVFLRLKNSTASAYGKAIDQMIRETTTTPRGQRVRRLLVDQMELFFGGGYRWAESKEGKGKSKMWEMGMRWAQPTTAVMRSAISENRNPLASIEEQVALSANNHFVAPQEAEAIYKSLAAGEEVIAPPTIAHRSIVIEDAVPF